MNDLRRSRLIFSLLMSFSMSTFMTLLVTWLNLGWVPEFFERWSHAFLAGWPAAFVITLFVAPAVQRATAWVNGWFSRRQSARY